MVKYQCLQLFTRPITTTTAITTTATSVSTITTTTSGVECNSKVGAGGQNLERRMWDSAKRWGFGVLPKNVLSLGN